MKEYAAFKVMREESSLMGFFGNRVVLVRWTAAMLAISALLFAAAVLMEGGEHREPASIAAQKEGAEAQEQGGHDEAAEGPTEEQARKSAEAGETGSHAEAGEPDGHTEETILGINLENPWLVWGFVGVSILLAAAVSRFGSIARLGNAALLLAILLAGVAAILDGREVFLQLARGNASVSGLAGLTALAHAAVVILAVLAWQAASGPGMEKDTQ
ncbi:hypothetical protein [Mesorhizobium humile]|uniref:Uncharacterized protein n=1 Tax=Mesorhizobium humile TaxID=3072313 RepID=A0ABU4Y9F1_9HYPH|nr:MULTISPECIES: hypothetical protein [unclassified Mesorhizobium]MDX8458155.1 hypothetical protein [Mesorhizobium sp. VK2D]MDX8483568.1 hypothetical protein [Mesorhizobium sp. VK2B]